MKKEEILRKYLGDEMFQFTGKHLLAIIYAAMEEYAKQGEGKVTVDEAAVMAVKISEKVEPKLTEQEQSFFIAGFCECAKWMNPQPDTQRLQESIDQLNNSKTITLTMEEVRSIMDVMTENDPSVLEAVKQAYLDKLFEK